MERTILVAEDSPTQAERLRVLLEGEGYRVDVVADGREGLERVQSAPPDLIISDVVMPVMDGYAFCQAVKSAARTRRIPFVLLTERNTPADFINGLQQGADNFITKPFEDDYLLGRVRRIFDNLELRRKGQLDVEITLTAGGQQITINADKQQMIELLFATLEELVRANGRLTEAQRIVEEYAKSLEAKVQERTQQLRDYAEKLTTLSRMSQLMTSAVDSHAVLTAAARSAVSLLGAKMARVWVDDPQARVLRVQGDFGLDPNFVQAVSRVPVLAYGVGLAGHVFESGVPEYVLDVQQDTRWADPQLAREAGLHAYAGIPLITAGNVVGVMAILLGEQRHFTDEEKELLDLLAGDAAIAIQNARLYQQLKDQLEELRRTQASLVQSEKLAAMGSLLAGVAHELNNPLGVVLGQAALLQHSVGSGPLAERAEQIALAAKRCARIVQNFLALARQRPLERQRVLLNQVIEEAVELIAYPLRVNNVEVQLELDPDLPLLWADPTQLHQVVVNLLTNAQDAMQQTPPPRHVTLTTRHDPGQARVRLEVADTGPGIPPEIQARIFEPFFTTKPPGKGTGLGLSLCRGIIESHRGTIWVESPPGQGALFVIALPVEAPPETAQEAQAAEMLPPIRGKAVLVVDDEPGIARTLAEMLALDGHEVETAPNGVQALAKLGERAYDLILSDLKMPELDGPGLYREVARRHPALCRRFIFLTGDTLGSETEAFLEQTRAPSLTKPFELEDVRQAVRRILGEA